MKVRMGFVSNSSASSFCIYGALLDKDEVLKILGLKEDPEEENPEVEFDIVDELVKKTGLDCGSYGDDYDVFYVGRSYDGLEDGETGKQFRSSVKTKLEKLLGKKVKCEHHEEAWNG